MLTFRALVNLHVTGFSKNVNYSSVPTNINHMLDAFQLPRPFPNFPLNCSIGNIFHSSRIKNYIRRLV